MDGKNDFPTLTHGINAVIVLLWIGLISFIISFIGVITGEFKYFIPMIIINWSYGILFMLKLGVDLRIREREGKENESD